MKSWLDLTEAQRKEYTDEFDKKNLTKDWNIRLVDGFVL